LGKFAETVAAVDVGRLAVPGHRRGVEEDSLVSLASGSLEIAAKVVG
jgi:hypothetical protein